MSKSEFTPETLEAILLALSFLESEILKDGEVAKAIRKTSEPEQLVVGLGAIAGAFLVSLRNLTGRSGESLVTELRNKLLNVNEE